MYAFDVYWKNLQMSPVEILTFMILEETDLGHRIP